MFTGGNQQNNDTRYSKFHSCLLINYRKWLINYYFKNMPFWMEFEIVTVGVDLSVGLSLKATITMNDTIINHTRVFSAYKTHTSALHHITGMSFKHWRNASIINQTGRKRPEKDKFLSLLVLFIMGNMKNKALVPTALSCTAVVLDAHKYGTCLKRQRNPLVIIWTSKRGKTCSIQDHYYSGFVVPLLLHRHRPQGFSQGQSASITRMSSERLSLIISYHASGSSHEISYLNHHQKMKGVRDRGDSDPVLETPVFPSMTSNNE